MRELHREGDGRPSWNGSLCCTGEGDAVLSAGQGRQEGHVCLGDDEQTSHIAFCAEEGEGDVC